MPGNNKIGGTGHQGLPAKTSELVSTAIHRFLTTHVPGLIGVTCLADGADQLFAQAVLSLGGELEVIVPAEKYRDGLDRRAQPVYDELIASARKIHRLPFVESTEAAHMAGGQAVVDRSQVLVAVWDGRPSRGHGGTADVVAYARTRGVPVEVVWPPGSSRD